MHDIDDCYLCGKAAGIEDLEVILEGKLDALDAALCEIDEDFEPEDDLEPDPSEGCSIREQFVEAYERHLLYPRSFSRDNLKACLQDVLVSAQLGGMTPSEFRGACGNKLVNLACELQQEYRAWIVARRM